MKFLQVLHSGVQVRRSAKMKFLQLAYGAWGEN